MITIDMTTKELVVVDELHFFRENDILTLEFDIGDYDVTGKQITIQFIPSKKESVPLVVTDGVVSVPVYAEYLTFGKNFAQFNFRWDDSLEQSGLIEWYIEKSLPVAEVVDGDVELMNYYLSEMLLAIEEADRVVDEAGDVRIELDASVSYAEDINDVLSDPITGTIKLADDMNTELEGTIVDAETAKSDLDDPITGAIKLATDAEDSLQATIDASQIGTLASLITTEKSNLVGAINEVDGDLTTHKAESVTSGNPHGIDAKANKAQENWITPTLANGWLADETNPVKYFKDNFGMVHLHGRINSGSANSAFTLPTGYRPSGANQFICGRGTSATTVVNVNNSGWVYMYTSTTDNITLSNISFRADS